MTIVGTNFTGETAVRFGSVTTSSFTVKSATTIVATAPPEAAGIVDITVTASGANSATSTADHYDYQTPTLTTITLTPATAVVLDGQQQSLSERNSDQFGSALTTQPAFTWSVGGLGSVTSIGLYSAPASGSGDGHCEGHQ